jgi:hypothetical protein
LKPVDRRGQVHYIGKFVSNTLHGETGKTKSGRPLPQKKSYRAGIDDFDTNELAHFGYYSSHKNGEKPGEQHLDDVEFDSSDVFSISSVKPADFKGLSTSIDNLQSPDEVLAIIKTRLTESNPLYRLAQLVSTGSAPFEVAIDLPKGADSSTINDLKGQFNKISTDFGEVLQPLAFCSNSISNDDIKVGNRSRGLIAYTTVTGPGNDSIVVVGKKTVKISTKSAAGRGQASAPYVSGLTPSLRARPDLQKKYPDEYNTLLLLGTATPEPGKNGQGVLPLAVPKILSQSDVDYITTTMYNNRTIANPDEFTDMPDSIRSLLPNPYPIHKNRGVGSSVYYVLNNTLMNLLSRELNYKDNKFNSKMSELIGDLLAQENIITVMTVPSFEIRGDQLIYSIEFKARPVGNIDLGGSPAYLTSGHGTFNDGARATLSYTVGIPGELPPAPGAKKIRNVRPTKPIKMANPDLFSIDDTPAQPAQPKTWLELANQLGIKNSQINGYSGGKLGTVLVGLGNKSPEEAKSLLKAQGIDIDDPETIEAIKSSDSVKESLDRIKKLIKY